MRPRVRTSAMLLLLLLATTAVSGLHAQSAPQAIAACAQIALDSERLACYDRAAGRSAQAVRSPEKPAATEQTLGSGSPGRSPRAFDAPVPKGTPSLLGAAWDLRPESKLYGIDLYHPNYLLFARWSDNPNNRPFSPLVSASGVSDQSIQPTEAKFQISIKSRLWVSRNRRWGVWAAYTQQSQWQVYNSALSRPFRETDFMPELFASYRMDRQVGKLRWRVLNFGFNHQSNGRADPLSRSWNRLFVEAGLEHGDFALIARAWLRLPESDSKDDNPDITDYYGHGQLTAFYRWRRNSFTVKARGNLQTGKGAAQFTWFTPRLLGPLHGYLQVFTGYGESLIDYNWNQTTVGFGIALNDEL